MVRVGVCVWLQGVKEAGLEDTQLFSISSPVGLQEPAVPDFTAACGKLAFIVVLLGITRIRVKIITCKSSLTAKSKENITVLAVDIWLMLPLRPEQYKNNIT